MDRLTPQERSQNMSRIRSAHTAPELLVRRALRKRRVGYRLHRKDLPGRPDIVLASRQTVIFVHGCFWHRHSGCRFAYMPKSRIEFWTEKFRRNVDRDRQNQQQLAEDGWRIAVIWECETRNASDIEARLDDILCVNGAADV